MNSESPETSGGAVGAVADGGDDDIFKHIKETVDELYKHCDNYETPNPLEKLTKTQALITKALQLLDSIPPDSRKAKLQRATYQYLRGKILNATFEYNPEAERHLEEAVKLNPCNADAWLVYANCMYMKEGTRGAIKCLKLALEKGVSTKIVIGVICRIEEKLTAAENGQAEHIKGLDWYSIGNIIFNQLASSNQVTKLLLNKAVESYDHAFPLVMIRWKPIIEFRRAMANLFIEEYFRALQGFKEADFVIPGLTGNGDNFPSVFVIADQANGWPYPNRATPYDNITVKYPYRKASQIDLVEGINKNLVVFGFIRLAINIRPVHTMFPQYFLLGEKKKTYLLSIYGLQHGTIKEMDHVMIIDPLFKVHDFTWEHRRYQFVTLRVDNLKKLIVNGIYLDS